MKSTIRIVLLLVVAMATVILFSCSVLPVSIEQRINDFINDLNGNRTNAYMDLDPNIGTYGTTRGSSTFWNVQFGTNVPFTYTPNPAVPSGQTVTIDIRDHSGTLLDTYTFTMVNAGTVSDNWVIHSLSGVSGGLIF
jgi:hypothetical protein